jgi:hypothetical protein
MKNILFFILILLLSSNSLFSNEINLKFKATKVTVYQQGAYIDFEFDANFDKGMNKLIIDSLPNGFDPSSFLLSSDKKIIISSLEWELKNDNDEDKIPKKIKALKDSIKLVEYDITDLTDQVSILTQEEDIIRNYSVKDAGGTKASVLELKAHADYYRTRSLEIRKEKLSINTRTDDLIKLKSQLQTRLSEENNSYYKDNYRLVAQIRSDNKESKKITFSCFTRNAGWYQEYEIRVKDTKSSFMINIPR